MTIEEELTALRRVADMAALCMIDLRTNLRDADKEYMAGEISNGAFRYVRDRHASLAIALNQAGYTERNLLFDIPSKPREDAASTCSAELVNSG